MVAQAGHAGSLELVAVAPNEPAEAAQLAVAERPVTWIQCLELAAVSALALVLATSAPLATTVFALLLFGMLHNYFELRYLIGRFGGLFRGRLAEAVLVGLTAIVLLRLLPVGAWGRTAEIVATYGVLGVVLAFRGRRSPFILAAGILVLLLALAASLAFADHHFVVITHLHNVLPLVFLWEWSARAARTGAGRAFRLLHLGWAVLLPLAILVGLFGEPAVADWTPAASIVGDVDGFVRALLPPGADSAFGARLLAVFALLQLMHYYVWCRFFPSVGAPEAARFDTAVSAVGLPSGRRLTLLVGLFAAATCLFMWADFRLGRSVYAALAGYHAYLEYALLLLFVLAWRRA